MNEFDPHNYTITVKRVLEDGEPLFKATVKELPHVAEYGDSYNDVYELAIDTIESLYGMAGDMGHPFPDPVDDNENFSGRVTLRLPKSLHRSASNMADAEGVSLNQFLVTTIAERIGGVQMYKMAAESLSAHVSVTNVRSVRGMPHYTLTSGTGAVQETNVLLDRGEGFCSMTNEMTAVIPESSRTRLIDRERQRDG